MTTIYTIGFSGKTNARFMESLDEAGILILADIRLWRAARFVPWASGVNLAAALGDRYRSMPELAPSKELLMEYKNGRIDWEGYERIFKDLLSARKIEELFTLDSLDKTCFLCAEKVVDRCHRRLVAEYLARHFPAVKIVHL